jgi:hypothetical protein
VPCYQWRWVCPLCSKPTAWWGSRTAHWCPLVIHAPGRHASDRFPILNSTTENDRGKWPDPAVQGDACLWIVCWLRVLQVGLMLLMAMAPVHAEAAGVHEGAPRVCCCGARGVRKGGGGGGRGGSTCEQLAPNTKLVMVNTLAACLGCSELRTWQGRSRALAGA